MKKLALAAFLLLSAPALAAPAKYTYDPAHTQIMFSVSHLGFSFSHGMFTKFSGGFTFDPVAPEASAADMTIDVASIDMNSKEWENHLRSKDFFNVEKFPTMTFKTTRVEKTGEKTANVTGDFTLLGVTKPVTLSVTFNGAGQHPMNKNMVAGFSAAGKIKRSDFGMTYALPNVGDEVNLMIQVEGVRQDFANDKR